MKKLFVFLLIVVCIFIAFMYPGRRVSEDRSPEILRGVNLGGWLADELRFGITRFDCNTPTISETLSQRFSVAAADEILEVYRNALLTTEDFTRIKSLGFNAVRLPVSASHLYDKQGSAIRFEQTAKLIAWVLEQAETNGLSVILNLRIRPGEWAAQPSVNGRRFAATWSERDVQSVAELWRRLAERFKNYPSLGAYDLSPGSCKADADWISAFTDWTMAIASQDFSRTIYAPWPRPAQGKFSEDSTFKNIRPGFSAEFLSEFIRSGDSAQGALVVLTQDLHMMDQYWAGQNIPRLASEYNPAMLDSANLEEINNFSDELRNNGWASMLWTFKSVRTGASDDERFVSILSGKPDLEQPDFDQASLEEIQNYFRSIEQINYSVQSQFQVPFAKPEVAGSGKKVKGASPSDTAKEPQITQKDWKIWNIGDVECSVQNKEDAKFSITSSGFGVGGFTDEFGFVSRERNENFIMSGIVSAFESSSPSAGAGLMVRQSREDNSPYLVVYKTPDGKVLSIVNHADGQPLLRRTLMNKSGSNYLRITTDGIVLKASCSPDGESWPVAANFTVPWLTNRVMAGAMVFSGHEYRTATAEFDRLIIE